MGSTPQIHQPTSWGRTSTIEIKHEKSKNKHRSHPCATTSFRPRWRNANSCSQVWVLPGRKWTFFPIYSVYSVDLLHYLTSLTWFYHIWFFRIPIPTSSCVLYSRWRSRKDISAHLATYLPPKRNGFYNVSAIFATFHALVVFRLFDFRSPQPLILSFWRLRVNPQSQRLAFFFHKKIMQEQQPNLKPAVHLEIHYRKTSRGRMAFWSFLVNWLPGCLTVPLKTSKKETPQTSEGKTCRLWLWGCLTRSSNPNVWFVLICFNMF